MGQGTTTAVQVDYNRVTRLLKNVLILLLAQNTPQLILLRWSAQMGSERAGDYSSSSTNNASSTMEGKEDTMTDCHRGLSFLL